MNISGQFAGGLHKFLCRIQQIQRLPFVLQPVVDFFPFGVIPDDVRRPKLGEVLTHGLDGAAGELGQLAWSKRPIVPQQQDQLVDNRIPHQPAKARTAVFGLFHPDASTAIAASLSRYFHVSAIPETSK